MHIQNYLPYVVDVRSTKDAQGYPFASLMLKATYTLPTAGNMPAVAQEQVPWFYSDVPVNATGAAACDHEVDMPDEKPFPEFLVAGSAHAPYGRPCERFAFGVAVGDTEKRLLAVGARTWQRGVLTGEASPIEPLLSVPASYAYGFGGMDPTSREDDPQWCPANFAGSGYSANPSSGKTDGMRLPQLEPLWRRCNRPGTRFPSLGLGPLGRAWVPRRNWAGTYDQQWQDTRWPDLPLDFDARYLQSAAQDQWLTSELSRLPVVLTNMTPAHGPHGSEVHFELPVLEYFATVIPRRGDRTRVQLRADTLVLEPDAQRFSVIARKQVPLNEGLHEIREVEFGDRRAPEARPTHVVIALEDFTRQLRQPRPGSTKR